MKKVLVIILCFLLPLTDLKIGDVQPAEMFVMFGLFAFVLVSMLNGFAFRMNRELWKLEKQYLLFLLLSFLLAMIALRLDFYPPTNISFLKTPPILSVARIVQIAVASSAMILLANMLSRDEKLLALFAKSYVFVGVINAIYAISSWFLLKLLGVNVGGAYETDVIRAKAFFVEGGPFGLYLISVILAAIFLFGVLRPSKWLRTIVISVLFLALALANSKSAFLAGIVLAAWYAVLGRSIRPLLLLAILFIPVLIFSGFVDRLLGYAISYAQFSLLAEADPYDTNLIMGRVMAMHLVPIMVAAHPALGIGLGNYSLMRNNPEYLMGLPPTDLWDLPGLGLVGYAAELGIPLLLFLVFLLWKPVKVARQKNVSNMVALLAGFQIFAHFFGTQLNFIYPWMVTALALGYIYGVDGRSTTQISPLQSNKI